MAINGPIAVQFTLRAGGRVGNWRSDGVVVLDAPPAAGHTPYRTDIFTIQAPTGNPPYSATLTSLSNGFAGTKPPTGEYIGNAWFCPTSDGNPANEYMLFQAQDVKSQIVDNANPGIGLDNQLWLYHGKTKKVWQLTWYKNLAQVDQHTLLVTPGGGVLGPQCSEDSDSSTNTLHIVYAHIIQATPQSIACITASTGQCGWFGDWELVYADIHFNGNDPNMDDPVCNGSNPETPCFTFTHGPPVNPRDLVNSPITPVSGSDGNVTQGACGAHGSYSLTTSISQAFSNIPLGAGVKIGTKYPYDYAIIDSINNNNQTLCLIQSSIQTGTALPFSIHNLNYIEPHRYLSDGGDLYYSTNSLFILHDSMGAVYNLTNNTLRVLNNGYQPGTTQPGITNPANTWFNEFLTPIPTNTTRTTPLPPQRAIFMSDRAVPSKYSNVPEWSDHYMCGPPNCQLPVRMTEYNYNDGSPGGPDATCSTCSPTVATRGAWSTDGTQYLTMNQNIVPNGSSTAELHLYTLRFPSAEMGGQAQLKGQTKLQ